MDRRQFLQSAAGGGMVFAAGCISLGGDSDPLNFGIENWRDERYAAEVELEKNEETVVLDASIDVPAHNDDSSDPVGTYIFDVTDVENGDIIDARVVIDDDELETRYEVTCTAVDDVENNLFLRIFSNVDRGMQFRGSEC